MLLPAGLVNVFLSGALVLWDPTLRALAVVGLLEIALVLALTLSAKEKEVEATTGRSPQSAAAAAPLANRH
jgi:NADH-quinone oxidoreductase subunit H